MIVSFENTQANENWSPRSLATLIKQKQSSGDEAKCLIAPTLLDLNADDVTNPPSCCRRSPSKGKPKNHLQANRKALKEKQQHNKDAELMRRAQEKARLHKREKKKDVLYGKVRSRVFASPSNECRDPSNAALYDDCSQSITSPFSADPTTYHIAFGKRMPISAPVHRPESVVSSTRHKSYGKVPSYITERRAKLAREEEELRRRQENAPPAPGLVLMEESDRLATLKLLEENEKEAREALRNIPFSMNLTRAARIREALDFRLKEIEDTRKVFSKDKVYVKEERKGRPTS